MHHNKQPLLYGAMVDSTLLLVCYFQIKVEGSTASVELILKVKGRSVDLTEEVYSADVTHFQSMDFGPSAKKLSSNSLPPLTTAAALPLTNSSGNVKCGDKIKVALESLPSPIPLPVSDSVSD